MWGVVELVNQRKMYSINVMGHSPLVDTTEAVEAVLGHKRVPSGGKCFGSRAGSNPVTPHKILLDGKPGEDLYAKNQGCKIRV